MSQARALALDLEILRRRAQLSFYVFCKGFLADFFTLPIAPFHLEMMATVESLNGDLWDCEEDPRGHGKSTIRSIASPLWLSLTGRKRYTVIISESATTARGYLTTIAKQLENNPRISTAYGYQGPDGVRLWQAGLIELPNGAMIAAIGKGQSPRGLLRHGRRPDCLIADDVQGSESVRSAEQRDKDWRWLVEELIPAGDEGKLDLLVNGTRLHRDCITARIATLARDGGRWKHRRRKAIEDGKALFPSKYSLERLARLRTDLGEHAFAREFMNDPRSDQDAPFREQDIRWEDPPHGILTERHLAMDPAKGTATGDYTALAEVVLSREPDGHPTHGIAWLTRCSVERENIELGGLRLFKYAADANGFGPPTRARIEEDQYGAIGRLIREQADRLKAQVPLEFVRQSTNKMERIVSSLQPAIQSGRLRFSPSLQGSRLMNQLLDLPGDHDDGPDALEMAYASAYTPLPGIYI